MREISESTPIIPSPHAGISYHVNTVQTASVPSSVVRLDFGTILDDGHTHATAISDVPVQSSIGRSCDAIVM